MRGPPLWPPIEVAGRVRDVVKEAMGLCGLEEKDRWVVERALFATDGDVNEAVILLTDDSEREKLESGGELDCFGEVTSDEAVSQLSTMFPTISIPVITNTLRKVSGDINRAAALLIGDGGDIGKEEEEEGDMCENGLFPLPPPSLSREQSITQSLVNMGEQMRIDEVPFLPFNWLLRVVHHLEDCVRTCNHRCLVCDRPVDHVGIKPVVCPSELCIMSYEELGVGLDVAGEIKRDPSLADLLISLLYASAHGGRIELMFPEQVRAGNESFMSGDGVKDVPKLQRVISLLPSVNLMIEWTDAGIFRGHMDQLDVLCYPLLRWMFSSNRSHLRCLKDHEKITGLTCDFQFVLLTGPVEKELEFQSLKRDTASNSSHYSSHGSTGSILAFHGSGVGNWHSILRTGLKNYSNTKFTHRFLDPHPSRFII